STSLDLLDPLALAAPLTGEVGFQGRQQLGHNLGPLFGRKLERFPKQPISSASHRRILLCDLLDEKGGGGQGPTVSSSAVPGAAGPFPASVVRRDAVHAMPVLRSCPTPADGAPRAYAAAPERSPPPAFNSTHRVTSEREKPEGVHTLKTT